MNNILQEMLNKYNCNTKEDYINSFKEIVQEIALYSLSLTDFFDNAAFYGGTALRIFYNLDRFSEDLDFSLCVNDVEFSLEKYFIELTKNFERVGLNFTPQIKEKNIESNIQSAFLKGNTLEHILLINPKTDIAKYIQKNETIKIKLEIDTNPPSGATYEYKYNNFPLPYKIKIYDESSLFAGKVHAVLCRSWKKRVKGRDLYDFEFYIKNGCLLNIEHLEKRMIQTGHWKEFEPLTLSKVKELLHNKIDEINFEKAKEDVLPFIENSFKLKMWEKTYFNYLVDQLKDNKVIVYKTLFDISKLRKAYEKKSAVICELSYSSNLHKNNKLRELKVKFNNFIVLDDSIINFGNKVVKEEIYYIIKGFSEVIYIKNNVNIDKVILLLKK